jgi:hypothetical protein
MPHGISWLLMAAKHEWETQGMDVPIATGWNTATERLEYVEIHDEEYAAKLKKTLEELFPTGSEGILRLRDIGVDEALKALQES